MDDLFHVIEDAQIILKAKGVYKQVKLYQRGGRLYAGWGSGFIVLMKSGGTSHPTVSWENMPSQLEISCDGFYLRYHHPLTFTAESAPKALK